MKHLIALARKYMQRQKFRTVLSFICITLSVFVFQMFCMAAILIRGVVMGDLTSWWGYWHMSLSDWIEEMPEPEKVFDVLPNHVAVDDYLIAQHRVAGGTGNADAEGKVNYLTFSVGDISWNVSRLQQIQAAGGMSTAPNVLYGIKVTGADICTLEPDEIILPFEFREEGFREGDVVTITVTPNRGVIREDVPEIRERIEQIIAENPEKAGLPWFTDSAGAAEAGDTDGIGEAEAAETVTGMPLRNFLNNERFLKDVEYTDVVSGEPYTVSMRIVGFNKDISFNWVRSFATLSVLTSVRSKLNLDDIMQGDFAVSGEDDPYLRDTTTWISLVDLTDRIDFDDAAEMLYRDLGLPEEKMQEMVHPSGAKAAALYNQELLALEFRGMDAITTWMTDLLPEFVTLVVLTLVFWALMRFVIDNAFEISVQERSAQFATLRIMGASRRQIAVLVCMEAIAYSAAAIPLGVLAAYGCKRLMITALENVNIPVLETSMPAVTAIGIVLALLAIFISAYTSSMWAARAYAPLEATKRSDLKGNKRETIWNKNLFGKTHAEKQQERSERSRRQSGNLKAPRKSKLNRKRRGFLVHYTMRNIRRTRKRFLISVITMTLGCGLFSFGISAGGCVLLELTSREFRREGDFYIRQVGYHPEILTEVEKEFTDNPNFSEWKTDIFVYTEFDWGNYLAAAKDLLPEEYLVPDREVEMSEIYGISLYLLPRRDYERDYAALTGISYDAWVASGCGIFSYSAYGVHGIESTDSPMLYRTGYAAAEGAHPVLEEYYGDQIPICGALCVDERMQGLCMLLPAELAESVIPQHLSKYRGDGRIRTTIALTVAGADKYLAAKEELTEFLSGTLSNYDRDPEMEDHFDDSTGLKYMAFAIGAICLIALLAVWGVGIFTMLNTINTGVLNRCDELMMLRMIGMSQKQMRRTVSLESMIYCTISTVIGGILGIAACLYLIMETVFDVHPQETFLILFAALLLTLLVNTLIARIAAKPGLRALHQRLEAGKMMQ